MDSGRRGRRCCSTSSAGGARSGTSGAGWEAEDEAAVDSSTRSMWHGMYSSVSPRSPRSAAVARGARSVASGGTSYTNIHGVDPVKNPPRNRRSDWAYSAGHPVYIHQPKNPNWHTAGPGVYEHSSEFDRDSKGGAMRWNKPTGTELSREPEYIRASKGSGAHIAHYDLFDDLASDAERRSGTATPGFTKDRRGRFGGHGSIYAHTDHEGAESGLERVHSDFGTSGTDSFVKCSWAG